MIIGVWMLRWHLREESLDSREYSPSFSGELFFLFSHPRKYRLFSWISREHAQARLLRLKPFAAVALPRSFAPVNRFPYGRTFRHPSRRLPDVSSEPAFYTGLGGFPAHVPPIKVTVSAGAKYGRRCDASEVNRSEGTAARRFCSVRTSPSHESITFRRIRNVRTPFFTSPIHLPSNDIIVRRWRRFKNLTALRYRNWRVRKFRQSPFLSEHYERIFLSR